MYRIDSICSNNREADDKEYTLLSEASLVFENKSDHDIQRILREVDNNELAIAMKELSGNARRRIFDNLSPRLANMIVEDLEYRGLIERIKMSEVNESVMKIMNIVLKLAKVREINDENLIALKIVMDIHNSDKAVCNMYKKRYSDLKQALDKLCT